MGWDRKSSAGDVLSRNSMISGNVNDTLLISKVLRDYQVLFTRLDHILTRRVWLCVETLRFCEPIMYMYICVIIVE